MSSTLTFLGTGTSQGIPMIGCNCHVCQSSDSKDKRLRTSALIEHKGFKIVIDCGPDFRQQMLRENISDIDAVLLTHQHKDHTGGMDDIRAFNYFRQKRYEAAKAAALQQANAAHQQETISGGAIQQENASRGELQQANLSGGAIQLENASRGELQQANAAHQQETPSEGALQQANLSGSAIQLANAAHQQENLSGGDHTNGTHAEAANTIDALSEDIDFPIYAEERVQEGLKLEYHYAFKEFKYPGVPDFKLITIDEDPFTITKTLPNAKLEVTPIRVMHYKLPILGFRFDNLAYITDGSAIPESEFEKLKDLDVLIINTVRHTKHISHFSLSEALDIIKRVGAKRNYLTHLSHQIGTHAELSAELAQWCNANNPSIEPAQFCNANQHPAELAQWCNANNPSASVSNISVMAAYDGLKIEF